MQTWPIFESGGAPSFGGSNLGSGSGDLFLALLEESAARQDAEAPVFPERARSDEARRETSHRAEDRREAPHRTEETSRPRPERHEEGRETETASRAEAAERTEQARPRPEQEAPEAAEDTYEAASQEAGSETEPEATAAAQGTSPAQTEASAEAPDAASEATGLANQAIPAALAEAKPTPRQTATPTASNNETAPEGSGEATAKAATPQGLAAGDPAAVPSGQAALAGVAAIPNVPGAQANSAAHTAAQPGTPANQGGAPKTDPMLATAMVSTDSRRITGGPQGVPSAEGGDAVASRALAAGSEGRVTPAAQTSGDQTSAGNMALASGLANNKTLGTGGTAVKPEFTLTTATGGAASAGQAETPLPLQSGLTSGQAGPAVARAPGELPLTANRPSGPAVPVGEVAVHIQRAAAKGEERIRIQLHPAELGQIDVRLKLGADGVTRAMVQVERPETLDLLQRDARGLERALQDAGLKTDSNSLSFSLREHGQGGLHERYGQNGGFDGGAEGQDMPEASEDREPQARPLVSNRALDIHV